LPLLNSDSKDLRFGSVAATVRTKRGVAVGGRGFPDQYQSRLEGVEVLAQTRFDARHDLLTRHGAQQAAGV